MTPRYEEALHVVGQEEELISQAATFRRTFGSLKVRNYRLFYIGQGISVVGTWMQRVAQAWLVLELTGSGTAVGTVAALQFLPLLVLAPLGGLVADRSDKRRILYFTQSLAALSALALGIVVLDSSVQLWMVYVLAMVLGLATSLDSPTRQSFVLEMVGREQVTNAVSLHSTLVNAARVIGPAVAGVLIVTVGIGWCFVINAISYLGLLAALLLMRGSELKPTPRQQRSRNQLREGFAYVRANREVSTPLLMMAVVGIFAYEYQVVLPLMARFTFAGDAQTFSLMTAAMGIGAVVGGLATAARANRPPLALARTSLAFGLVQVVASAMPTLEVTLVILVILGVTSVSFIALGNSTLQLASRPEMRGRVMGLWVVAFLGSTTFGGPAMGWIGEHVGPRWAFALGGAATILAAGFAWPRLRRIQIKEPPTDGAGVIPAPPAKL